ncbi:MAG: thioredoxin fold domain-containing protein [Betaproteobacteria bacterium]
MKTFLALLSALLFSITTFSVAAVESALPAAKDLASGARAAEQRNMPLIVMVSLAGCPYCEVIRRSHLMPLLKDDAATGPVIRQVEVNGSQVMRDFNGEDITHKAFAQRYKVKIAPVVFFFNSRGDIVAGPLVGSMIPDFYGAYFEMALAEAQVKIRDAKPKASP